MVEVPIINNSFKILSLEAKDIYAAMHLKKSNNNGYSIRRSDGSILLKKFKNTLDWSLDTMKLQEEHYKKTRKKNFYFIAGKKKYTQVVINVEFNYSYKLFNQLGKNTYIKAGYEFEDCQFNDGVCVRDGELIALQTNVEVQSPVPQDILGKCFTFADGFYALSGNMPTLMSRSDLRDHLYENGFICDGIEYVRYKRSSGSSRVGKCLFVQKSIAAQMRKWDACGLDIRDNDTIDLAAWEAYISLPMSSIIDTMEIYPNEILVVDDYESVFKDDVVVVEARDGRLTAEEKEAEIANNIWDGESLMDVSKFGQYADKGMLLLRNRFFKTCAFNANIQKWFEDNGITRVEQLNGRTRASTVEEIKLITTPSSIKYLKFGTLDEWLDNIQPIFGVVKFEKQTHYFDGRMVQSHYQLINTLHLTYSNVEELLTPSLNYIGLVRSDPDVLRYHIGYPFRIDDDDEEPNPLKSKNDIIFKMLGINNKFAKTKLYIDFRNDIVKGFIRNLKQGHILLHGNYSTLLGNGLELLQQAIGVFKGNSVLNRGTIHCTKFEYGKTVLGSRSPHITMGNILLATNIANEQLDKYFNLTNEIVCINAIGENFQQRLNGCDYDSDSILLTDNEILIKAAAENFDRFKVPTSFVEAQKTKRLYNNAHKSNLDVKTSVNKIGEIVNLSQQLNSLFWERINHGASYEECMPLYNDICKLAVLSGIEIDKAKKEYIINSSNEILWLKNKYKLEKNGQVEKPLFFKMITLENGFELSDNVTYRYFDTAMDYLQKIIASANFRQARKYKTDVIPFMDIVKKPEMTQRQGYYSKQRDKIIDTIVAYKDQIKKLYIDYATKTPEEKKMIWQEVAALRQQCIDEVDKMSNAEYTMYITLKELDNKEMRSIYRFLFEILFGKPNKSFFNMLKESKENIKELKEKEGGEIQIYTMNFAKVQGDFYKNDT